MTKDANARAMSSLVGLSVGDSLGERFFGPPETVLRRIAERQLPTSRAPWRYTDDTEMALSVVSVLREFGCIDQNALAQSFALRMEDNRGYGRGAYEILSGIRRGEPWIALSHGAFEGRGSYGNGAAMRVAPLGAYFADDVERCVSEAILQAEITHANPEGIAGAVAVAVATGLVWQNEHSFSPFIQEVMQYVPASTTRQGIERALELPADTTIYQAAQILGNGSKISSQDTVPLCIWVASRHHGNYEEAFWETVVALGDRDTTCAIVGGIVGVNTDVPKAWKNQCETLPI